MGKKERKKRDPHYRRMRYVSAFFLGLATLVIAAGIVFVIWGAVTYDNSRDWVNNPGKIPWLAGVIGGGGGAIIGFIGAGFATLDRVKWGKSDRISLFVMVLLFVGIVEVIISLIVSFYKA